MRERERERVNFDFHELKAGKILDLSKFLKKDIRNLISLRLAHEKTIR